MVDADNFCQCLRENNTNKKLYRFIPLDIMYRKGVFLENSVPQTLYRDDSLGLVV